MLSLSKNPALVGEIAGAQAIVTPPTATGTVSLWADGVLIDTQPVSGGTAQFVGAASYEPSSAYLVATFNGSTSFAASTSNSLRQFWVRPSAVALQATPSTVTVGGASNLVATVTPSTATGTVTFKDGTTTLQTVTIASGGIASYSQTFTTAGAKAITAVYSGDTTNAASTSTATALTVNKAAATATLAASPSPAKVNETVTLTATVSPSAAIGSVTFKDGATTLGTGTISAGKATLSTSFTTTGTKSLTAVYGGDANYNTVTSAVTSLTVNAAAAATTTTLVAAPSPTTVGANTTLTATVTPNTATGTVTFKDGTTTLGTGNITAGKATLSTSFAAAGAKSLTASYGGDTKNAASTSTATALTVNKAAATATLAASPSPAKVNETVTLTATVSPSAATGSVTFKDGTTTLGTGTISAGKATLSASFTTTGTKSLTAVYGGDANYNTVTSAVTSLTVNAAAAATTTTLSVSPNPVGLSGTVTMAATVTGANPSGNVTFNAQGAVLASAPVTAGIASFSVAANQLGSGSYTVTAAYGGDAGNQASTSAAVNLTIEKAVTSVPEAGPLSISYGYDPMGNLTTVKLPRGAGQPVAREQTFEYDSLGRRIVSKLAAPALAASQPAITQGYDGQDQLTRVTDPRKLATTYKVDGLGRRLNQTSPDTGTGTADATFYEDGALKTRTDARGKVFTYGRDDLSRVTQISYSSGTATTFQYDNCVAGTTTSVGQLCKLTDESGNTTYTHDGFGRVLVKTQTVTNGSTSRSFILSHTWGEPGTGAETGKLKSLVYPSKAKLNFSYNSNGTLGGISVNPVNSAGSATDTATTLTVLNSLAYNGLGAIKSWTWGGAVAYSRGFDSHGRLQTYPLGNPLGTGTAAGLTRTLGYDDAGRITSYTHSGSAANPSSFDQTFGYDGLDRLTANQQATTYGYGYDDTGNRTSLKVAGNSFPQTISPTSNRVTTETGASGSKTLLYYADGSLQSDGTNTYTYSDRGRLSKATLATGEAVNYLYNGFEQRTLKTGPTTKVDSGARYYAYDEEGHLIGEYDASGNPAYEVVYLGDTPVAVITQTRTGSPVQISTQIHYIYADHIDTPRVIVQSSNHAIRWRWDQAEAFGNSVANDNPSALGVFTFNLRFPGQTFDKETGWFYNHHRDYRAAAGRYAQSDPIGLEGGINTYAYVEGNPLSNADPSGLDWRCTNYGPVTRCAKVQPVAVPELSPDSQPSQSVPDLFGWAFKNRKPRWITGKQEKYWDQANCAEGDPCEQIKAYVRQEILQARKKRDNMLFDKTLFRNAYDTPNTAVTGVAGTWMGHRKDLIGKVDKIDEMITMGGAMGCNMSEEIIMKSGLDIPNQPLSP